MSTCQHLYKYFKLKNGQYFPDSPRSMCIGYALTYLDSITIKLLLLYSIFYWQRSIEFPNFSSLIILNIKFTSLKAQIELKATWQFNISTRKFSKLHSGNVYLYIHNIFVREIYSDVYHPPLSLMLCKIQSLNLEIRVQTPGRLGSPHPIPQLIIPARNQRPSFPRSCRGPPESP